MVRGSCEVTASQTHRHACFSRIPFDCGDGSSLGNGACTRLRTVFRSVQDCLLVVACPHGRVLAVEMGMWMVLFFVVFECLNSAVVSTTRFPGNFSVVIL